MSEFQDIAEIHSLFGADDLELKIKEAKAKESAIREARVTELLGDEDDINSNAGMLRLLAEYIKKSDTQTPITVTLKLEPLTDKDANPLSSDEIERAADINSNVLGYLFELYGTSFNKLDHEEPLDIEDGSTIVTRTYFGDEGFGFETTAIFLPGHDYDQSPVPDFYSAEAKTIIDGELKGGIRLSDIEFFPEG